MATEDFEFEEVESPIIPAAPKRPSVVEQMASAKRATASASASLSPDDPRSPPPLPAPERTDSDPERPAKRRKRAKPAPAPTGGAGGAHAAPSARLPALQLPPRPTPPILPKIDDPVANTAGFARWAGPEHQPLFGAPTFPTNRTSSANSSTSSTSSNKLGRIPIVEGGGNWKHFGNGADGTRSVDVHRPLWGMTERALTPTNGSDDGSSGATSNGHDSAKGKGRGRPGEGKSESDAVDLTGDANGDSAPPSRYASPVPFAGPGSGPNHQPHQLGLGGGARKYTAPPAFHAGYQQILAMKQAAARAGSQPASGAGASTPGASRSVAAPHPYSALTRLPPQQPQSYPPYSQSPSTTAATASASASISAAAAAAAAAAVATSTPRHQGLAVPPAVIGVPPLPVVNPIPLPDDAPVCVGLLSSLVLILYPVKDLEGAAKTGPNGMVIPQTLPVTLLRSAPSGGNETIRVISRSGEQFGVVEHRVANVLGPFIGQVNTYSGCGPAGGWFNPLIHRPSPPPPPVLSAKAALRDPPASKDDSSDDDIVETDGYNGKPKPRQHQLNDDREVYLECCVVRRGEQSPIMLPLQLLVFCLPSAIGRVAAAMSANQVYLEHPISYDPHLHAGCRYGNPHNPQHRQAEQEALRRRLMIGAAGGAYGGQYSRGSAQAKSVEVQREQVDEVFKSLRSGADLDEVEPDPIVVTRLYPHQKQALSFMIDRERLRDVSDAPSRSPNQLKEDEAEDNLVSLWKRKRDAYGRVTGWVNVVTEVAKQGPEPPPQCRGSILADDMGLGKTISIISLIATTLEQARAYGEQPPTTELDSSAFDALGAHGADDPVTMKSFANAFNMPSIGGSGRGKKKEGKNAKKRAEAEAERLAGLKIRSRATLIVCPLSTVQNWESQIDEHVGHPHTGPAGSSSSSPSSAATPKLVSAGGSASSAEVKAEDKEEREEQDKKKPLLRNTADAAAQGLTTSALKVYVYHGNGRTGDLAKLADNDVVITTYSLLGSEYSRQNRGKSGGEKDKEKEKEKEKEDGDSSEGFVEEVDAEGNPVSGMTTPKAGGGSGKGAKRKRKGDGQPSPLQGIQWFRVVLDEAHMIKEHTTIQARAACDLVAERRVCLTGTPLQNSLNDLFSLLRFLRLEPFTDRSLWTVHIGAPAKLGDPLGVSRLQLIMRHLALRRTKESKDRDGKPILTLPPKKEDMVFLDLDEREKAFYHKYHQRSKKTFLTLEKTDSLLKNYCSILQELLRLRQICAHMGLVAEGEDAKGEDLVQTIKDHGLSKTRAVQLLGLFRDTGAAQCAECGIELIPSSLATVREDAEEDAKKPGPKRGRKKGGLAVEGEETLPPEQRPVLTRCQHLFCLACFRASVSEGWPAKCQAGDRAICSACREEITPVLDAIEVLPTELETYLLENAGATGPAAGEKEKKKDSKPPPERVVEHSTKIRHLLMDLLPFSQANPASVNFAPNAMDDPDPGDPNAAFKPVKGVVVKSVVFSQWTKLLDRIADALDEFGIVYGRLDGTMSRAERGRSMDRLRLEPQCEVLLVSLRAGGVGLNLTAAQRVYVLEPYWNPAVENQAVDRVHRLGQTKPVQTIRYIINGSIEQNMLDVQKRKTELANMSLGQTLSKAELAKRRVEDLKTLFRDPAEMGAAARAERGSPEGPAANAAMDTDP